MKKIISSLLLILCIQFVSAQRSSFFISSNNLFFEGKTMFEDKNYAGCQDKLYEFISQTQDANLIRESSYMIAACGYYQGKQGIGDILKDYLNQYPETNHKDQLYLMIGSVHFQSKEYSLALFWLKQCNIDNLPVDEQEDYSYITAVSSMETGDYDEAYRLFGLLKKYDSKYKNAATYYLGYIAYTNKEYNEALSLFNQLKGNTEYQPEVSYYITQINFVQGKYSQTISDGLKLLNSHPNNERNNELYRIIGISYYEERDYHSASQYLKRYSESVAEPERNDMYLLGLSYYYQKQYTQAIPAFGHCISREDILSQNANLLLGQSYLKTGNQNKALMSFSIAANYDFDPQVKEAATYNYAMLLHKTSTSAFGESVTVLENFLNTYPHSTYADQVNDCLVEVYLTTKNYDVALKSIDKIKNPGRKILDAKQKIYYHLGTVYFTNTQYESAIDYFTKALNMGNHAPVEKAGSAYWRGESYYRLGKYDLAINDYQTFRSSGIQSGILNNLVNYNLGYCYFNKEQYNLASDLFSRYINVESDKTRISLADAYARLGDCYFHGRNFTAAENAYSQSVALQPSMGDYANFQKGFVMGLQKDYKGKITQMDFVIKNYPDSRLLPDALYEKGRSYVMLDNSKSAIETYNILCDKYPDSRMARKAALQIGLLYFNSNDPQKASVAYKNVINKYPGSEEAKVAIQDLKSVYVDLGDIAGYAQYIGTLQGVAKFEPSEQDSLTFLSAEKLFAKGDASQAQSALKKYLQSFPNGAFQTKTHYYLGNSYYEQNNTQAAKEEFRKVLEVGNSEYAEESLIHLSQIQYKENDYSGAMISYERLSNTAETNAGITTGLLGIIRCGTHLNKYADVLNASNKLLNINNLAPEIQAEAKYGQAKAYIALNEAGKALPDLQELAKDTRTTFGAEAKYLLAQYYFDHKQTDKAEAEVLDYIKIGTPHSYWLARGFILLSDVYVSKNDKIQARQYLESLQQNYKQNDDIQGMINERLAKL